MLKGQWRNGLTTKTYHAIKPLRPRAVYLLPLHLIQINESCYH